MSDDLRLDSHRSMDELGKFSVNLELHGVNLSDEESQDLLETVMRQATEDCFAGGADFIGHVKGCLLTSDDRIVRANMVSIRTGVESENLLDGRGFQGGRLMMHLILHGIWDPDVRRITLDAISRVMDERGVGYRLIQDYCEAVV